MKQQSLPKGVAKMYVFCDDMTVCLLFKATKPDGNKLPRFNMQLKPLAFGMSFIAPVDQSPDKTDDNLGKTISLGRALKMYHQLYDKEPNAIHGFIKSGKITGLSIGV